VLQAGFDRVRGTSRTSAEPLPRMPADRIALEASGAIRAWLWSLRWEHYFEQTRVPRAVFGTLAYESPSAAYDMLSAWLERRIDTRQGSWRIRLSVTNLLDEEARPHVGFLKDVAPLPGRNWLLSVNYRY
jgi:iron complex outermembrane receptor protein